jgi:hypothetical protein
VNGKRNGKGIYTFASGAQYEGSYVDGLKHGFGTFTDGKTSYSGKFDFDAK